MNSVSFQDLKVSFSNFVKEGVKQVGQLGQRGVEWVQTVPEKMQKSQNVAILTFASLNVVFFGLINSIENRLAKALEKPNQALSTQRKVFKHLVIDVILTGSLGLGFNVLLSKLTRYPLSKVVLAAITASFVAFRLLLSYFSKKDSPIINQPTQPTQPTQPMNAAIQPLNAANQPIDAANNPIITDQPIVPTNDPIITDQQQLNDAYQRQLNIEQLNNVLDQNQIMQIIAQNTLLNSVLIQDESEETEISKQAEASKISDFQAFKESLIGPALAIKYTPENTKTEESIHETEISTEPQPQPLTQPQSKMGKAIGAMKAYNPFKNWIK